MRIKRAFLFSAGLGTRLRPYTLAVPKPLLPVHGRPIVEYILAYLSGIGVTEVTANTCYLAEQFEPLPEVAARYGIRLALSRQPQCYHHGGDLAYAKRFLESLAEDEVFLGLNADTIFHIDPDELSGLAESVSPEAPVLVACFQSEVNPLRIHAGRLIGTGAGLYDERFATLPCEMADDFGLKVFHSGIRNELPDAPGELSFYGPEGLAGRLVAGGKEVLCRPVTQFERVEIGTVADYERVEENRALQSIIDRISRA